MSAYPGSIDSDATLYVAKDNIATTLNAAMAVGDTVAIVVSSTGWAANMIATVESEQMLVSSVAGNQITLSRAFNGTVAVAHAARKPFSNFVDAAYQSSAKAAIIAIETALGANLINIPTAPSLNAAQYAFAAQTPGGSLIIGANTVTLTPVPAGVNGTDSNHYLYISNGTGTAEAVLISGGTAVAGSASGTVIVTCAHTHTGAWTIQSATGGISEAIWALGSSGGAVTFGAGSATLHAPVYNRPIPMWITGLGYEATTFNVAADFPLTAPGVFNWTTNPGGSTVLMPGGMKDFTLFFVQPDSTNVATYTHWPPAFNLASTHRPFFSGIDVQNAWDGWKSSSNDGLTVKDVTISFYHRGFDLDGQTDTVRLEGVHAWPTGNTANQDTAFTAASTGNVLLYFGNVQNFIVSNLATIAGGGVANMHAGSGGSPSGTMVNCDFDTVGGYVQSDGNVIVTNSETSLLGATVAFTVTGGLLTLIAPNIFVNGGVTGKVCSVNIAAAATGAAALVTPGLTIIGGQIVNFENTVDTIQATTSGSFTGIARVRLVGTQFDRIENVVATGVTVKQTAGTGTMRVIAIGTAHNDVGIGSGTAFSLATDDYHVISGNEGGGWGYSVAGRTKTQWIENLNFASNISSLVNPLAVSAQISATSLISNKTENYIATESGSNNAIAGALVDAAGVNVPLAAGLKVVVKLAHTLQAGANTFVFNTVSKNIKSARNVANDIATAYAATGSITLLYDGTEWVDVSQ